MRGRRLDASAGSYGVRRTFAILTSSGLTGQFAGVTDTLSFYSSSLANIFSYNGEWSDRQRADALAARAAYRW